MSTVLESIGIETTENWMSNSDSKKRSLPEPICGDLMVKSSLKKCKSDDGPASYVRQLINNLSDEICAMHETEITTPNRIVESLVFAINDEGQIVLWNSEMEKLTGKSYSEVEGTLIKDIFEQKAWKQLSAPLNDILLRNGIRNRFSVTIRPNKSENLMVFSGIACRCPKETNSLIVGVGKLQNIEDAFFSLKDECSRYTAINQYLCHNLGNSLSIAMSALEQPTLPELRSSEDQSNVNVNILRHSMQHMNHLVGDVFDWTLLQQYGASRLSEKEHVNILRDILEPLQKKFQSTKEKVSIRLQCSDTLHADTFKRKLLQALSFFVEDSLKFMEHGVLTIGCKQDSTGKLQITLKDSGPGMDIPAATSRDFFVPNDSVQGQGFGPCVARDLLRRMDATCVYSKICASCDYEILGSQIQITLPFTSCVHQNGEEVLLNKEEVVATIPLKVLIIDDEPLVCALMKRKLQRILPNAEFEVAANGEQAIEIAKHKDFDICTVDFHMGPGMNGAITSSELKRLQPNMLLIGVSANAANHVFAGSEVTVVWSKPFPNAEDMLENIRAYLHEIKAC